MNIVKKQSRIVPGVLLLCFILVSSCSSARLQRQTKSLKRYQAFQNPEEITIKGYTEDVMEPFLTRDGTYLFFNNSNSPSVDTNLHIARKIDEVTFDYLGQLDGSNSDALDGVPTMDSQSNFYFVSTRDYENSLSTIFQGNFSGLSVTRPVIVKGISEMKFGHLNFDVEISPDGKTLYFVDGVFRKGPVPRSSNLAIATRESDGFKRHPDSQLLTRQLNTDALEYAVCISADEMEIFFTRAIQSTTYILRSTRPSRKQPFDEPQLVEAITGFAEAPTLSPDERSLYYHVKKGNRFVLYRVTR